MISPSFATRHFRRIFILLACLLMAALSPAHASLADAPGADLQVSLITYGPGETYWERFGHDAIELRDTKSGEAVNFNYGVFDFDEKGFLLNFARGHMHYLMDAAPSDTDESFYVETGRSINQQVLTLNADQAAALRDFLLWNLRPENAGYNYDYYIDNCSTRVRDALDRALGGVIESQLSARPGGMTYRQQTARLMSAQPWLMLVLDLGLGPYADQPLNAWQESFLPAVLATQLRSVRIDDQHGGTRPLVQGDRLVSPNRLDVPPPSAPDLRLPLMLVGLSLAILLLLTRRWWTTGYAVLASVYLVAAGLVGVLLLGLWALTDHHAAWANANLWLFNPAAFLLLPTVWRSRRGLAASRFIDIVLLLQLVAGMVALLLHLLPGVTQQNQPWLLLALPIWLALAWTCRKSQ
ncbi:MAG: DUF4105 domain-containing protein [Rhodanobacter sp.]